LNLIYWQDGSVRVKYREILLPSPAIAGFGLICSIVLGIAAGYATSMTIGISLANFGLTLTCFLLVKFIRRITVSDSLQVGNYSLPIKLIQNVKAINHDEFRLSVTPQDLVLGARTGISYLQFEINGEHEPFKRWFVGTRKPKEFLASLT